MRLLAALLAAALLAFSAPAAADAPSLRRIADLDATVELVLVKDEPGVLNGGFLAAGTYCQFIFCQTVPDTIVIWAGPDVPRELVLAVYLHEVGHLHQSREGVLRRMAPVDREWDADARAARALCALGLNGPHLMAAVVEHVWARGYRGDPDHGTALDRIEHALALTCSGVPAPAKVQAP